MFPIPTARLALVLFVASAVVLAVPLTPPIGLIVVDAVIIVVAVVDALIATDPAAVEVERDLPAALTLGGGGGEIRWRVRNPTPRRLRVAVADALAPSLQPASRRFQLRVPARGEVFASTTIDPTRRGRFAPAEIVVRVDGPLGLASRQRARATSDVLRVLPPFRSQAQAELRVHRALRLEIGLRSTRSRGGGTEFDSLREYSIDDDSHRMDWAATARTAKPIVRTYRAERNQQVVVLLDNGRVMAGQVQGAPRVEWAMDAAMTLTAVATGLGDRCGLVTFDREVRTVVPPNHGRVQLARVTEAIYQLEPRLVESDYLGAFATTLARFRRRAMLVLVTELSEEAVSETFIPALPLLLARHLVVVAAAADPDVARWAAALPSEPSAAYRTAAALGAAERRARTAARLRALGAIVVDDVPSVLSARLADTYLDVKAAGRL